MLFDSSPSKRFIAYVVCFLAGVAMASVLLDGRTGFFLMWPLVGVAAGLLLWFWRRRMARTVIWCLLAAILGAARLNAALPAISDAHIASLAGQKVAVRGWVAAEPDIRFDHARYVVAALGEQKGRVLVRADLYPKLTYGDEVEVTCNLKKPGTVEGFRYDRYLRLFDVYAYCSSREIKVLSSGVYGSRYFSSLLLLKAGMQGIIAENLSEPHASFLGGLLYGLRSTIPESLQEAFNASGTTHIIAISGYNITIVTTLIILLFTSVGIPRSWAFWLCLAAVGSFVLFAGASASVVRAGLMGVLALTAGQIGRLSHPAPLLAATASAMVLQNPFVLLFDAGFQLSFLAVVGLIYVAPGLGERLKKFWRRPAGLRRALAETLSAIALTTPLMLYLFGRFSVIAPVANVAILLAIPWIMFTGFGAVVLSMVFVPFGAVLFWVTWVLLSYVITAVRFFASLPFSAQTAALPLWIVAIIYIVCLYWLFIKRPRRAAPQARV